MQYDLIGRKAILAFLGLSDWRQVAARIGKGCPVVREGGIGRWLANSRAVEEWIAKGQSRRP
jgi:phage terminase Nu1 subunit (DNA packaging protein)